MDTEMPFEYYTMPFCKPPEGVRRIANTANPGAILEGLRIENSPYNFTMQVRDIASWRREALALLALPPSDPPVCAMRHADAAEGRLGMQARGLPQGADCR